MITLADLLNNNNKLSLNYNPNYNPNQNLDYNINANTNFIPQQAPQTNNIAQLTTNTPNYTQPNIRNILRPAINPEVEKLYMQDLLPKKKGKIGQFLDKIGLTPAVALQLGGGITALTGGSPFLAAGLAQSGDKLAQQQIEQEEMTKNRRADYMKQMQGEQSKYDLAAAKAKQIMNLFPEGLPENMEIVGYSAEGFPMIRQKKANARIYQVDDEGNLLPAGEVEANAKVYKKSQGLKEKLKETEEKEKIKLKNLPIAEKIKAEEAMKPGTTGYANVALKLSDDFNNSVKNFSEIKRNFRTMESALEKSSTNKSDKIATDQAIISTFNKLLDPSSVVRESEYARTPEGMGILERAEGYVDKLKRGGAGLTEENRQEIVDMAKRLYLIANEQYSQQRVNYSGLAKEYGLNPKLVIGNDLSYTPKSYDNKNLSKKQQQNRQQYNY